jgi:hypothetical protein
MEKFYTEKVTEKDNQLNAQHTVQPSKSLRPSQKTKDT